MPPPLPNRSQTAIPENQPAVDSGASTPLARSGSTQSAGESIDNGQGRIFPCDQCGADLEFAIGCQHLKCPFCGAEKALEFQPGVEVQERDIGEMLARLTELRRLGVKDQQQTSEVRCESCGGQVTFSGALTSSECPYCASPIQRENIHTSELRVPVDGVLPFLVDYQQAADRLRTWVKTMWFAPNEFKQKGVEGKFQGVYEPYWTFDFQTYTRYAGQRGDHYWVTVGQGKDERKELRINWSFRTGDFHRFFDDLLCFASTGLPSWMTQQLEPWPLEKCQPFNQQFLAGFLARTYDITLEAGLKDARSRAEAALDLEVRQRIGGDEQRVDHVQNQFNAVTYKHLLLPLWLLVYRYKGKIYRLAVNGGTGEVQGERPYSAWKIFFTVLICLLIAAGIALLVQH
ncbi:MAG: hypothetical protein JWM11_2217 [Planctomycetaceae bacterium]|nr:hypothetical protein [Planctomycetaceae bacterium]